MVHAAAMRLLLPFLALATDVFAAPPLILVYSRTAGYRHDSIPTAYAHLSLPELPTHLLPSSIEALRQIGLSTSLYTPTFSEDPSLFTPSQLAPFSAIVFLSNSDEVLDTAVGQPALKGWLQSGGALVGLHAATACLFDDLAFGVAMGSWFDYHPTLQNASFTKLISHPTIDMIPTPYNYIEEVYHFRTDPRSVNATVLLSVDPTSFVDPQAGTRPYFQGSPPPIAWYRDSPVDLGNGTGGERMTGRLWMTSLGHTNETWRNEVHLAHVQAGIKWALEGSSLAVAATTAIGSMASSRASVVAASQSTTANFRATVSSTPSSAAAASASPAPSAAVESTGFRSSSVAGTMTAVALAIGMGSILMWF